MNYELGGYELGDASNLADARDYFAWEEKLHRDEIARKVSREPKNAVRPPAGEETDFESIKNAKEPKKRIAYLWEFGRLWLYLFSVMWKNGPAGHLLRAMVSGVPGVSPHTCDEWLLRTPFLTLPDEVQKDIIAIHSEEVMTHNIGKMPSRVYRLKNLAPIKGEAFTPARQNIMSDEIIRTRKTDNERTVCFTIDASLNPVDIRAGVDDLVKRILHSCRGIKSAARPMTRNPKHIGVSMKHLAVLGRFRWATAYMERFEVMPHENPKQGGLPAEWKPMAKMFKKPIEFERCEATVLRIMKEIFGDFPSHR